MAKGKATGPTDGIMKVVSSVLKSLNPLSIEREDDQSNPYGAGALVPYYDHDFLDRLVRESTILPQCISSYARNISGYGIVVEWIGDVKEEDVTSDMEVEKKKILSILETLSLDKPLEELTSKTVEDREKYATAYIEVIRNIGGQVVELKNVDVETVEVKTREKALTDHKVWRGGREVPKRTRFRKYVQSDAGTTIYFKEFGDPRPMSFETGKYSGEGESLGIDEQANEILQLRLGQGAYGTPRYEGQIMNVDGARKAQYINWNYFKQGKHIPMAIVVSNGYIPKTTKDELDTYMKNIEGDAGQHKWLIIESVATSDSPLENAPAAKVELKSLTDTLQKDGLFHEYLDDSRKDVQSAFNLPDIYVGRTTDYNRATALAAIEKTEDQVFKPMRRSLSWVFTNQILGDYQMKFCKVVLKSPDLKNTEHEQIMFGHAIKNMTPNQSNKLYFDSMNEEYEEIQEEWADVPEYVFGSQSVTAPGKTEGPLIGKDIITKSLNSEEILSELRGIRKSYESKTFNEYP